MFDLTAEEIRVLGCLIEKERTTPDQYPLTVNSLRLACNQSTNRDPVVDYDDTTVRQALQQLKERGWARTTSASMNDRVPKYKQLLGEALQLTVPQISILAVLMLRGPQTPGELKQRTERLSAFPDIAAVHVELDDLIQQGLVENLGRRPGQKEDRYRHLFDGRNELPSVAAANGDTGEPAAAAAPATPAEPDRLAAIEAELAEIKRELAELRSRLAGDDN